MRSVLWLLTLWMLPLAAEAADPGKETIGEVEVVVYFGTDGDPAAAGDRSAEVDDKTAVRPYLTLGASFYSQDDYSTQARLKGAPGGGFDTTLPLDDKVAKVGAGLQLLTDGPWDLRVQYEGRFADHATSHAGTLKASFAF